MLRRTVAVLEKLVIVESPNKVIKIEALLSDPKVIPDWSFKQERLRRAGVGAEKVVAMATNGHFMALQEICWTRRTARGASQLDKHGGMDSNESFPSNGTLAEYTLEWELMPGRRIKETLERYMEQKLDHVSEIILATDPDREGELIAVHALQTIRRLYPRMGVPFSRAYMHSITVDGIRKAMKERNLEICDYDLANAAETRHVMDRIFGFLGSSVVRAANAQMRSVGRVQTPALILINEREEKVSSSLAKNKSTFAVEVMCQFPDSYAGLYAQVVTIQPEKKDATAHWTNEFEALKYLQQWKLDSCRNFSVTQNPVVTTSKIQPPQPLTMATAIAKANRQMKMSSEAVSGCLQDLFQLGHITYPRTDSTRIDESALKLIYNTVKKLFGKELLYRLEDRTDSDADGKRGKRKGKKKNTKTPSKSERVIANVEDAHEAIRPTNIEVDGDSLSLSPETRAVYELVRRHTLAAFMVPQTIEKVSLVVKFTSGSGEKFRLSLGGRRVVEPGWTCAFRKGITASDEDEVATEGEDGLVEGTDPVEDTLSQDEFAAILNLRKTLSDPKMLELVEVRFPFVRENRPTTVSPHSEGTLIEELKKNGVGRPSTYPTIVKTLLARGYIQINAKGRCETTPVGRLLVTTAKSMFPSLVDIGFTASFEKQLDTIAKPNATRRPAILRGTKVSQADYVLSMFLSTFLNYVSEATRMQRARVVERSMRLKHQQEGKSEEFDARLEESIEVAKKRVIDTTVDMSELPKLHSNFSALQRALNDYLRIHFPPALVDSAIDGAASNNSTGGGKLKTTSNK
ncbi:Toprim domain [Trypanosoma vivax]|uniref:DNA topoisomerase n=1 Tax=Trypanosoma vivax (strain Y486) TaxID=1055687 RepID=G0U5I3_TRYVY|nr:Toprim domain [Trypanosoma vivax]CCC51134.1 putative DNA topoisomerase IA [Trypanosoma vivax Y486]